MLKTAEQHEMLAVLYTSIRRLNQRTHKLVSEVGLHYDAAIWDEIQADDREIARLWREVYKIEQIWPQD